jgi:UDP-N-acetylmuramoylalanine--D-glutamate ligase
MAEFSVAGERVLVLGAARSGVAAALLLADRGARVTLSDLRPAMSDANDVARLRQRGVMLELGGHRPETVAGASLVVLSPGVPLSQPALEQARRQEIPIIGEIELASYWLRGRVVAITGTKGKSTTTTLAGRMLQAGGIRTLVGGNIGVPLSAQVAASTPDTVHVVEVSSFQLETIQTFHPWIAVLLNFSPDHLDRHATVEEYARAKAKIFENQNERDWVVINADDPQALALARSGRGRQLRFSMNASIEEGVVVTSGAISYRHEGEDQSMVPLAAVKLIGPHLRADVAAAAAVAKLSGISPADMTRAVESFGGLEHALELVTNLHGVRFVNDSKATNVESALRAIESFGQGLVVILGGRYKGGDFGRLREPLTSRGATVVAIGEARPLLHEALESAVPIRDVASMADAVRQAWEDARPHGTVLLAPACASFDMFADYADRGRSFKHEVARLEAEAGEAENPFPAEHR